MSEATRAYYDDFAEGYEARRRPNDPDGYHALIDDLEVALVERHGKGKHILECGCGTGLLLERFAGFAERAVGIDLSPGMLEKARARGLSVREALFELLQTERPRQACFHHPKASEAALACVVRQRA